MALVPWRSNTFFLTGTIRGAFDNGALDLIEAAIGPGHSRALLVALYEGCDGLLQATIDLAESVAGELVYKRLNTLDPLGDGDPLTPEGQARFPGRAARVALENACVRQASSTDHLANAYLRLAWETNAALPEEVSACGFDPDQPEPKNWASIEKVRQGLRQARRNPLGVLTAFELTQPFRELIAERSLRETRRLRHQIVHRDRPTYREAPAFGRQSRWLEGRISIKFPIDQTELDQLPTLAERRRTVAGATEKSLRFAEALWDTTARWLRTIDIWVVRDDEGVKVTTEHSGTIRHPRERRDPSPFLVVAEP